MANNVIKVGTADDSLSIQQGPFAVGAAGLGDYGPTSRTNYYAGINVPEGGYVFYQTDISGNITANVAHDDTQAMFFLQSYGATGTTLNEMLTWASDSGSIIGLSADITTTTILESIGSSGTSGSSGSGGGGSSQFATAWLVNTSRNYNSVSYNEVCNEEGSYGVIYTSEDSFTIGSTEFFEDAQLTERLYYGGIMKFIDLNQIYYFENDSVRKLLTCPYPYSNFQNKNFAYFTINGSLTNTYNNQYGQPVMFYYDSTTYPGGNFDTYTDFMSITDDSISQNYSVGDYLYLRLTNKIARRFVVVSSNTIESVSNAFYIMNAAKYVYSDPTLDLCSYGGPYLLPISRSVDLSTNSGNISLEFGKWIDFGIDGPDGGSTIYAHFASTVLQFTLPANANSSDAGSKTGRSVCS